MAIDKEKINQPKIKKIKNKILTIYNIPITQELLFGGIGCLGFLIFYSFLPKICWEEVYRNIICAIIVFSFFIAFIILNQPNSKINLFKVNYKRNIILFTIFNLAILLFLFYRTEFGYGGIIADNYYRSASITRMANSGFPQDFTYKGLTAFMAPFYWYILALIAIIFQIEPYKMVKYGFLFSYYILPILLYETWKKIFDKKKSFYITVLFFTFVANYYEIIWIDHLIAYLFFIPFFIYYFENYKNRDFTQKNYIVAGLIGSFLVCTFYLYFILVPIYLFIILIQSLFQKNFLIFKEKFRRILYITIYAIIFSSWFWIPLTVNILIIGSESHQNFFFPKYALDMPFTEYFKFNLFAIILIIGLIFILLRFGKSKILTILGNLVISVYILYLFGYIGLLIGFPLVHFRVLIISYYLLVISFVLFYIEFFRILKKQNIFNEFKQKLNFERVEIFLLIIIIFYQNYENTVDLYKSRQYQQALDEEVPEDLIDIIKELDDYENKVFLTQYYEVAAYLPIYMFVVFNSHYSHPSGLNNERVAFLRKIAESKSSKEFYQEIIGSKFGPINYFYLEPCDINATEFVFEAAEIENYPYRMDVKIYFRAELFENTDYFKKRIIDGEIIYETKY